MTSTMFDSLPRFASILAAGMQHSNYTSHLRQINSVMHSCRSTCRPPKFSLIPMPFQCFCVPTAGLAINRMLLEGPRRHVVRQKFPGPLRSSRPPHLHTSQPRLRQREEPWGAGEGSWLLKPGFGILLYPRRDERRAACDGGLCRRCSCPGVGGGAESPRGRIDGVVASVSCAREC